MQELKDIKVIPVRGMNDREGNSIFYQVGRFGFLIDAGIHPEEDIDEEEFIEIYKEFDKNIDALFITHPHADHARGAIWIARHFNIPIYVREDDKLFLAKWARYDNVNLDEIKFVSIKNGDSLEFGTVKINIFQWEHSTPKSLAFDIQAFGKRVVHLSDGKLAGIYLKSHKDNLQTMRELFTSPVDLLVVDIANIKKKGFKLPEYPIIESITKIILTNPDQKHFIFMHSTSIERMEAIITILLEIIKQPIVENDQYEKIKSGGIKFLFRGRAMQDAIEIISKIHGIEDLRKSLDRVDAKTPVVFGTTGGDSSYDKRLIRNSCSTKISSNALVIKPGDTIIYSAGFIPSQDKKITKKRIEAEKTAIRAIKKCGGLVFMNYGQDRFLGLEGEVFAGEFHRGGHEQQDGWMQVANILKPKIILPFHAEKSSIAILNTLIKTINNEAIVLDLENLSPITL